MTDFDVEVELYVKRVYKRIVADDHGSASIEAARMAREELVADPAIAVVSSIRTQRSETPDMRELP